MAGQQRVVRVAWCDKFRRPSVEDLRAGLPRAMHRVFDEAREGLAPGGVSEALAWQGVPWRWTLVYSAGPSAEGPRTLGYLIPCPDRLQVCVPLKREHIDALPSKRLKKSIRDGVAFARVVAGVWWATWDVPSRTALDEVLDVAVRKHRMMTGAVTGRAVGA